MQLKYNNKAHQLTRVARKKRTKWPQMDNYIASPITRYYIDPTDVTVRTQQTPKKPFLRVGDVE